MTESARRAGVRPARSLAALRRMHPGLRVIAPARSKDALIAAIYLAVDAPDHAASNYDALADVLGDLGWLPLRPVELAWVQDPRLPTQVDRQVLDIVGAAAEESARGPRPLTVFRLDP